MYFVSGYLPVRCLVHICNASGRMRHQAWAPKCNGRQRVQQIYIQRGKRQGRTGCKIGFFCANRMEPKGGTEKGTPVPLDHHGCRSDRSWRIRPWPIRQRRVCTGGGDQWQKRNATQKKKERRRRRDNKKKKEKRQ